MHDSFLTYLQKFHSITSIALYCLQENHKSKLRLKGKAYVLLSGSVENV